MTLNEAIQHAEAVANGQCGECAEEHRQLAEWLKELKERRKTERHGHWINDSIYHCRCSICDHIVDGEIHYYNEDSFHNDNAYCEHCGAKMDEEVTE